MTDRDGFPTGEGSLRRRAIEAAALADECRAAAEVAPVVAEVLLRAARAIDTRPDPCEKCGARSCEMQWHQVDDLGSVMGFRVTWERLYCYFCNHTHLERGERPAEVTL